MINYPKSNPNFSMNLKEHYKDRIIEKYQKEFIED